MTNTLPTPKAVDADGWLLDPTDWDETFAEDAATAVGITLTPDHWRIIRFMRAWVADRGVSPDARWVIRHLATSESARRNRLFELFPHGYVGQACRIAGMMRPRAWSTG